MYLQPIAIQTNFDNNLIDETIKVGDRVILRDGSCLTLLSSKIKSNDTMDNKIFNSRLEKLLIVESYEEITGSQETLKSITGTVKEINQKQLFLIITATKYITYLQDIVVTIGEADFRTASKLVIKLRKRNYGKYID